MKDLLTPEPPTVETAGVEGGGGSLAAAPTASAERAAWLEKRRNGIGGSEVAAIIGVSPWTSRYALWADKVGLLPSIDQTEAMEFGLRAEPMLTEWLQDRTGIRIDGIQRHAIHPETPWHLCTLDGETATSVVEFKATSDTPESWDAQIPLHYQCQGQWSMHVTGKDECVFGVLHLAFGRPRFRTYILARDQTDIDMLVEAVDTFWLAHVVTGIAPQVDGSESTADALSVMFPGDLEADTVEADSSMRDVCIELKAAKAEIKDLKNYVTLCENRIKETLKDSPILTHGTDAKGRPVVLATWKPGTRTSIDSKALQAEQPEIAKQYTRTTETRTLLVKTIKE